MDLKAINETRRLPDDLSEILGKVAGRITLQRGDRNGTVLSIRAIDLEYLQLLVGLNSTELLDRLHKRGLIFASKN